MEKKKKIKKEERIETIFQCDFCGRELNQWNRIGEGREDFCDKLCKKLYKKSPKQVKKLFENQSAKRKEIISQIQNKISELL